MMKIRRVIILAYSAIVVIMLANFFYYQSLYNNQIKYIIKLLDRQVQIVGLEVDSTNNDFESDLTRIYFDKDLTGFFDKSKPDIKYRVTEQMKLFFSRYKDFVIKMRLYDNNLNEYTLSKDEITNDWIEGDYTALDQRQIKKMDILEKSGGEFNYYGTILMKNGGEPIGRKRARRVVGWSGLRTGRKYLGRRIFADNEIIIRSDCHISFIPAARRRKSS